MLTSSDGQTLRSGAADCRRVPRLFASPRLSYVLLLVMLIAGNLLIFSDYILGNDCLVFEDLGADSVHHNLPVMYYLSQAHSAGRYWIHGSVLGNNVFLFPWISVFNPILPLLGWQATVSDFAARMVYYPVLESLLAGSFLYWYLVRSGSSTVAAIVSSCGYALCGAFTAISTWMVMLAAPLLAALAIVLWAHKLWQQDGRWYVFSIAVAYFALTTQPLVTVYQLCVFFALYLAFDKIVTAEKPSWHDVRHLLSNAWRTCVAGGVGLLMVAFFLLPHVYYMVLHSSRAPGAGIPLSATPRVDDVFVAFLRAFSNDLIGTANIWTSRYQYRNYMELPFLYAGLVLVLVIPSYCILECYRRRSKRDLVALGVLLVPLALAQVFPGMRASLFFAGRVAISAGRASSRSPPWPSPGIGRSTRCSYRRTCDERRRWYSRPSP